MSQWHGYFKDLHSELPGLHTYVRMDMCCAWACRHTGNADRCNHNAAQRLLLPCSSPSYGAEDNSDSQKITSTLQNQKKTLHTIPSYSFNIHFNIIFPSTPKTSLSALCIKWLSLRQTYTDQLLRIQIISCVKDNFTFFSVHHITRNIFLQG